MKGPRPGQSERPQYPSPTFKNNSNGSTLITCYFAFLFLVHFQWYRFQKAIWNIHQPSWSPSGSSSFCSLSVWRPPFPRLPDSLVQPAPRPSVSASVRTRRFLNYIFNHLFHCWMLIHLSHRSLSRSLVRHAPTGNININSKLKRITFSLQFSAAKRTSRLHICIWFQIIILGSFGLHSDGVGDADEKVHFIFCHSVWGWLVLIIGINARDPKEPEGVWLSFYALLREVSV